MTEDHGVPGSTPGTSIYTTKSCVISLFGTRTRGFDRATLRDKLIFINSSGVASSPGPPFDMPKVPRNEKQIKDFHSFNKKSNE